MAFVSPLLSLERNEIRKQSWAAIVFFCARECAVRVSPRFGDFFFLTSSHPTNLFFSPNSEKLIKIPSSSSSSLLFSFYVRYASTLLDHVGTQLARGTAAVAAAANNFLPK